MTTNGRIRRGERSTRMNCRSVAMTGLLLLVPLSPPVKTSAWQQHEARHVPVHFSGTMKPFAQADGLYSLEYPSDWNAHARGALTNIGSTESLIRTERGGYRTVYGAIVGVIDDPAADRTSLSLEASTRAVVDGILKRNPHQALRETVSADRPLGGAPAYRAIMLGTSPVTGKGERAEVVCRRLDDGRLLYMILVSPTDAYPQLKQALTTLRDSLRAPAAPGH